MKWFEFSQNNSGGGFIIDRDSGLGISVWIEAKNAAAANEKAEEIGIYFNGCAAGRDCRCCGDRWYAVWPTDKGEDKITHNKSNLRSGPSYAHHACGLIEDLDA